MRDLLLVLADDLKSLYLENMDFMGFIIANYTELLGRGFYAIMGMVIVAATYMRAGPGAALIVTLLGWGIFIAALPQNAIAISMILMSLAGGLLIAWFFLSRRGSS